MSSFLFDTLVNHVGISERYSGNNHLVERTIGSSRPKVTDCGKGGFSMNYTSGEVSGIKGPSESLGCKRVNQVFTLRFGEFSFPS